MLRRLYIMYTSHHTRRESGLQKSSMLQWSLGSPTKGVACEMACPRRPPCVSLHTISQLHTTARLPSVRCAGVKRPGHRPKPSQIKSSQASSQAKSSRVESSRVESSQVNSSREHPGHAPYATSPPCSPTIKFAQQVGCGLLGCGLLGCGLLDDAPVLHQKPAAVRVRE